MDIELELKIDEVIKRLNKYKNNDTWYKLLEDKEKIESKIDDTIYEVFRYDKYEFDYIFSSEFDDYETPQIIILDAFPVVLLTDKPVHVL